MTDIRKLPQELKEEGLFCLWRYEQRGDRCTKVPYDPRTGRMAQSNEPATFAKLETALASQAGYEGLGLGIFGDICAIDIDHCVNEDGTFTQLGMHVMAIMDSYTEYSPSGRGLHILFRAPGFPYDKAAYYINNAKLGLEVYVAGATSKYVTVTGNMLPDSDRSLRDCGERLQGVLDRYMRREPQQLAPPRNLDGRLPLLPGDLPAALPSLPAPAPAAAAVSPALAFEDLQLLNKAIASRGGQQFEVLYGGNTQGYPSHSEADLALCGKLAFWTGCDRARMDRMFRASGLMRGDKWDRPQSGSTYGALTLDRALRDKQDSWKPTLRGALEAPKDPGKEPEEKIPEPSVPAGEADTRPWPVLGLSKAPLPFPLEALPTLGQTVARSVADCVQVPLDMPACFLLGALSTAVVGRAQVEPWPHYREPLQLFILTSANPSERKSATMEMMFGPIHRYQQAENKRRKPLIARSAGRREAAEQNIKRALNSNSKSEIDAAYQALEDLEEVHPYELIISDATTEAMAMCMARNEGRVALISAEGGMLMNLCGRYSAQQAANVDVILHGYSGEPMYQERVGRGSLQIDRTAVSLCLAAQPGVVQGFLNNAAMAECGMVSRFLVASPRTLLGSRKLRGLPPDEIALRAWEEKICRLLDRKEQMLLRPDDDAAALFDIWGEEVEQRLCPGRDLHDLSGGFGGKLRGNTARIAGLLRLLEDDEPEGYLPPDETGQQVAHYRILGKHMLGAIDIARYFLAHMRQLCGSEDLSPEADCVLKLLVKMGVKQVSVTALRSKLRGHRGLETVEQVEAVLADLVEEGFLRRAAQQPVLSPARGRPSKPLYEINPALTEQQEPSVYQKELALGMREVLSGDMRAYAQADEEGKSRMRKAYVSLRQKLEER
ncbi:MAG: DUF3987 domain-containing protein [Christensenellales bacterium]